MIDGDVGAHYRAARLRLTALLRDQPTAAWTTAVPACPGWDVQAVVSHLVGVIEDAMAGRLSGPPSEEQTADQVARHASDDPRQLLDQWTEWAPFFEDVIGRGAIWPAFLDVMTHTHDVAGALGDRADRDDAATRQAARVMTASLDVSPVVSFDLGDERLGGAAPTHVVTTSAFEVVRIRMGRRSPEQVVAMAWSPPLPSVPDGLFVWGPRTEPLVE